MWRRASAKLLALRSVARPNRIVTSSLSSTTLQPSATIVARHYSGNVSKRFEDVMPITTGHERESLKLSLRLVSVLVQGRDILDINFPEGPVGTKEAPAVVKSYYDQRIVGCPGAEGAFEEWCIPNKRANGRESPYSQTRKKVPEKVTQVLASLTTISSDSTTEDPFDFSNDDYFKVKGPEKRGDYIRCVGRMATLWQLESALRESSL